MGFTMHSLRNTLRGALRNPCAWPIYSAISRGPSAHPTLSSISDPRSSTVHKWLEVFEVDQHLSRLSFIHIGKSGGTSIINHFLSNKVLLKEYHLKRPIWKPDHWYFTWVRHPLKRFVSSFNYAKAITEFPVEDVRGKPITLENTIAPAKIQSLMTNGFAFNPTYDGLIASFETANELAEALDSSSEELRERAQRLMTDPTEHIFKGLGWYTGNGAFFEAFSKQILCVGRLEHMEDDYRTFIEKVSNVGASPVGKTPGRMREGSKALTTELSPRAVRNLHTFYRDTDFHTVQLLAREKWIPAETLDAYMSWD